MGSCCWSGGRLASSCLTGSRLAVVRDIDIAVGGRAHEAALQIAGACAAAANVREADAAIGRVADCEATFEGLGGLVAEVSAVTVGRALHGVSYASVIGVFASERAA